jgi:hypothetical protein
MLAISADQRKQLDEIQKDIDAHLDRLLTADQKKQFAVWPRNSDGDMIDNSSQPGQVMAGHDQDRLKLTEDQKKDVAALQKSLDGRFDRVLNAAQKHQIKSVFSPQGPPPGGPGPGDPPQPGKIFSPAQQDTLKLSQMQKTRLEEIQKEIDARLETLLTEDQKKQLQVMRRRTGGGPGGNGPPGGRPLFRALRYAADFPGFAGRTLTPGRTLEELQPKESEKKAVPK